jgi:hypothetical protein
MDRIRGKILKVLGPGRFDLLIRVQQSFNKNRYCRVERIQATEHPRVGEEPALVIGPWLRGRSVEVDIMARSEFGVLIGRYRVADERISSTSSGAGLQRRSSQRK